MMDRAKVISNLAATATTNDVVIFDRQLLSDLIDTINAIAEGRRNWSDILPERLDRLIAWPAQHRRGELLRIAFALHRTPPTMATLAIVGMLRKAFNVEIIRDRRTPE
jgi:hypothetical protein